MSDEPNPQPDADPEPEGVVEVELKPGQKERVVPATVIAAERARIRRVEAEKHAKEIEPLKAEAARAQQLAADLAAIQPHVEYLKQHPHLMQRDQPPEVQAVSDDEAERYARDYELYTANGLDLAKAKRIIARQRDDIKRVSAEAAREAIAPIQAQTSKQLSERNFMWAASQKGADGRPLVDPKLLAEEWAQLPAESTADGRVAELILEKAIGRMFRTGKQPPPAPQFEPTFSESPGGRAPSYQISDLEKKVARNAGISETDWQKTAKGYQPDRINVLGD